MLRISHFDLYFFLFLFCFGLFISYFIIPFFFNTDFLPGDPSEYWFFARTISFFDFDSLDTFLIGGQGIVRFYTLVPDNFFARTFISLINSFLLFISLYIFRLALLDLRFYVPKFSFYAVSFFCLLPLYLWIWQPSKEVLALLSVSCFFRFITLQTLNIRISIYFFILSLLCSLFSRQYLIVVMAFVFLIFIKRSFLILTFLAVVSLFFYSFGYLSPLFKSIVSPPVLFAEGSYGASLDYLSCVSFYNSLPSYSPVDMINGFRCRSYSLMGSQGVLFIDQYFAPIIVDSDSFIRLVLLVIYSFYGFFSPGLFSLFYNIESLTIFSIFVFQAIFFSCLFLYFLNFLKFRFIFFFLFCKLILSVLEPNFLTLFRYSFPFSYFFVVYVIVLFLSLSTYRGIRF